MHLIHVSALALWLFLGEPFSFEFSSQTDENGTAYLVINAQDASGSVKVKLRGDDGSTLERSLNVRAGKPSKLTWKQKNPLVKYELDIEGGEAFTNYSFEVRRAVAGGKAGKIQMLSGREEIVDRRTIRYRTPFTIANYTFQIYSTDGVMIVDRLVTDKPVEAGSEITQNWDHPDDVFMIHFKGEDDLGWFAEDRQVPWSVTIPHTEVNFDTNKSIIKPGEAPKIDDAFAVLAHELDGLDRANKAVGAELSAQLYIVGYTDTVGQPGKNQVLSGDRAKAIAQYFYDKGTWCEIYYAGMGERGLAVETGDSVDEVRNRRALYLLGVQKPPGGGHVPQQGAWKKLSDARPRALMTLPDLPPSYVEFLEKRRAARGGAAKTDLSGGLEGSKSDSKGTPSDDSEPSRERFDPSSDGPPPVEGEPGATKKGCSVDPGLGRSEWILFAVACLGIRRRRRVISALP